MIVPPVGGLGELPRPPARAEEARAPASQVRRRRPPARPKGSAGSGGLRRRAPEAISSLEQTQDSANSAAQALATGNVSDPESAVVTVEDAQMAMDLASQIRTKATEAAQSIFQTQV